MSESCPVLSPAERQVADMIQWADEVLIATVKTALQAAVDQAAAQFVKTGSAERPPAYEYFAAVLHQHMYCVMCGADPDTMAGGNPQIAAHVLENGRNIANHYWGGAIEPLAMLQDRSGPAIE